MGKRSRKKERKQNQQSEDTMDSMNVNQEKINNSQQEDSSHEEPYGLDDITTIGKYLREIREKKDLSLKAISQNTKISVTLLEHLEEDNLEKLPNKAYVTGFVKSYAKALGTSQRSALEHLESTYRFFEPEPIVEEVEEPTAKVPLPSVEKDLLIKVAGAILAGITVITLIIVSFSGNEEAPEVVQEPITAQTLGADTPLKSEEVIAITTPQQQEETIAQEPVKAVESKPVEAPKVEEVKKVEVVKKEEVKQVVAEKKVEDDEESDSGEKKEKYTFRPISADLFSFTELDKQKLDELIPPNYQAALAKGKQNVFINALKGDTWITYKADDQPIKKFVLKKGRFLMIRGDSIRLFLGNVHASKIFLNNKLLNIESRSGVKSLVFPEEEKKNYHLPLFVYKDDGTVISSEEYIKENNIDI